VGRWAGGQVGRWAGEGPGGMCTGCWQEVQVNTLRCACCKAMRTMPCRGLQASNAGSKGSPGAALQLQQRLLQSYGSGAARQARAGMRQLTVSSRHAGVQRPW
jgi:hypothetical protein